MAEAPQTYHFRVEALNVKTIRDLRDCCVNAKGLMEPAERRPNRPQIEWYRECICTRLKANALGRFFIYSKEGRTGT